MPNQDINALRLRTLDLIQNARIVNQRDDLRSVRDIDGLLSELQDWSLRLGQVSLANLFPKFAIEMNDIWVDEVVFGQLELLRSYDEKVEAITASSRSLTIYMDWTSSNIKHEDLVQISQCVQKISGHIKRTSTGFKLVFPCSLSRMRMMPFIRRNQKFVAPAGQFVQFQPDSEEVETSGTLTLRTGMSNHYLQADRMMLAENMNVFEVPANIERPKGVGAIALDGSGEIYFLWGET